MYIRERFHPIKTSADYRDSFISKKCIPLESFIDSLPVIFPYDVVAVDVAVMSVFSAYESEIFFRMADSKRLGRRLGRSLGMLEGMVVGLGLLGDLVVH